MNINTSRILNKAVINERYKQCGPLFKALDEKSIPFVVHKGAPLSKMIYGDPYHRISGDIDLLLPREYIDQAKSVLTSLRFRQGRLADGEFIPATRQELVFHMAHTHQTAPFFIDTGNSLCPYVCVDINMEIYWSESGRHTDIATFLNDCVQFEVLNGNRVPVLPPEKEFVTMCLHHYKDIFSLYLLYHRNGYPASHLEDIAGFIKNVPMDRNKLIDIIRQQGAERFVFDCLDMSRRFYGKLSDMSLPEALHQPEFENDFQYFGLTEAERGIWPGNPIVILKAGKMRETLERMLSESDMEKIRLNDIYVG